MNLASLMPDWNSLDSVRNAHSFLELWSIRLFAVLVVCDVVAHLIEDSHKYKAKLIERVGFLCFAFAVFAELGAYKYGHRSDELSENVIRSLSATAGQAATDSQNALRDSNAALKQSEQAKIDAGAAAKIADGAGTSAAKAFVLAGNAKSEAEAFEREFNDDLNLVRQRIRENSLPRKINLSARQVGSPREAEFKSLLQFSGTRAYIQREFNDPNREEEKLCEQISVLLRNAGWIPTIVAPAPKDATVPPGVWLITDDEFKMPPMYTRSETPHQPSQSTRAAAALLPLLQLDLGPNDDRMLPGVNRTFDTFFEGNYTYLMRRYGFAVPPGGASVIISVGPIPMNDSWPTFTPHAIPASKTSAKSTNK